MKGVNKVILVCTLCRDPEMKYTADQKAIANISAATNESWKDKQGNKQEKAEFHRVVIFGKLAEIAGQYLKKGSQVYFEGKLQTRKWQDQSGQDKYSTEVVIDGFNGQMQMLGGKQGTAPQQQASGHQETREHHPEHRQSTRHQLHQRCYQSQA